MVEFMLNIKSEEAHRLASQLAALTGKSMTRAVTEALKEKLEALERERDRETLVKDILDMGKECRARMKEPYLSTDIDELLYDERGLPK